MNIKNGKKYEFPPLFLRNCSQPFAHFCGNTLSKRPYISAQRRFFQKGPRTIVVLRWKNRSLERKWRSSPKQPILTKKTPKGTILLNLGYFQQKLVRIGQFWDEMHFLSRNLFVQRRATIFCGLFWKKSVGSSYGAYLRGLAAKMTKNGQKLRNVFVKRGEICCSPPNFLNF